MANSLFGTFAINICGKRRERASSLLHIGEVAVRFPTQIVFCAALLAGLSAAAAEDTSATNPAPSAPSSLVLHFDAGSATVRQQDVALLDQAARLYRAGNPIVMIVTGSADTTGSAAVNLRLSELRANNVLQGLVARGIPVQRFQVIAKGQTDLVVPTPPETAEGRNRRVEITWRGHEVASCRSTVRPWRTADRPAWFDRFRPPVRLRGAAGRKGGARQQRSRSVRLRRGSLH